MSMLKTLFQALCCLWLLLGAPLALAVENVVYFHNDALGSPVAATDGSGQLLWTEAYEPYGTRVLKPGGPNRLWYTGKPEEPELGLNYFGARWYEPGIGRFHGIDPVDFHEGNVQSFNRYAYANNNPYAYVDPDGNVPIPLIIWGIGAAMTAYDTHQTYQHEGAGAAAQSLAVNGVLTAVAGGLGTVLKAAHQAKRAVEAGNGATKKGGDFFEGTKYTDKVKKQMQQDDFHSFPESVKGFQDAGKLSKLKGGDGAVRDKLEIAGGYRGREGKFEFIKEPNGSINHRLFKPGKE